MKNYGVTTKCRECGCAAFFNGRLWTHDFSLADGDHDVKPSTRAANKVNAR